MRFKTFLENLEYVKDNGKDRYGNNILLMDVRDDIFLHFTVKDRVPEIIRSNKLLLNSPYEKFGPEAIYAISTLYGVLVKGVQVSHVKGDLGAILFTTKVVPKYGLVEEVVWEDDVEFETVKEIDIKEAQRMLGKPLIDIDDMDMVVYDEKTFKYYMDVKGSK